MWFTYEGTYVQGVQWDGYWFSEQPEWLNGVSNVEWGQPGSLLTLDEVGIAQVISAFGRISSGFPGDWLIKQDDGSLWFYPDADVQQMFVRSDPPEWPPLWMTEPHFEEGAPVFDPNQPAQPPAGFDAYTWWGDDSALKNPAPTSPGP